MTDSTTDNVKNNLDEFSEVARIELRKYAQCLWDKYLYSQHEDTSWHAKIDVVNKLLSILDNIERRKQNPSFNELESPLVEFRSVLEFFKATLVKKGQDALFIKSRSLLAKFFPLSPGIQATLSEPRQAMLLAKNLETLVEKTQESIYLSLSYKELLLEFAVFRK